MNKINDGFLYESLNVIDLGKKYRMGEVVKKVDKSKVKEGITRFRSGHNMYIQSGDTIYYAGLWFWGVDSLTQKMNGRKAREFYQSTGIALFDFDEPSIGSFYRSYWEKAVGYHPPRYRTPGFFEWLFGINCNCTIPATADLVNLESRY